MDDSIVLQLIVVLTAFIGLIFAVRKVYRLFRPISITPSIHYPSDRSIRGQIGAEVINKSNEAQYIIRCNAIGTYNLKYILLKHIRSPLTKPRLYKTIWYGTMSFSPIGDDEKIKLEPFELINKKHQLSNHALSFFDTPKFLIEVQLSTGHVIRSKSLNVPLTWHYSYRGREALSENT